MKKTWPAMPLLRSGLLLVAATGARAGPRDEGLPQRNLIVEWRMSGQGQTQQRDVGIRTGQIIVDSRGNVVGRTSIGTENYQTESQANTVQQVQVLNGGRAKLYVGRSQPYTVWQWAWSGSATAGGSLGSYGPATQQGSASGAGYPVNVLPQTVWIDIGQGLNVRPRWPGGHAPVTVEIEAQARQPAQISGSGGMGGTYGGQLDPDGQTRRIEVGSTLSVSLGEWVVVARSGGQVQRRQSGSLSTRDLDDSQSEQLEIRVTAP